VEDPAACCENKFPKFALGFHTRDLINHFFFRLNITKIPSKISIVGNKY
jgi:hypothetical protein